MTILDTDLIVGMLRGGEDAIKKINDIGKRDDNLCTTSITSYELLKGAYISSNPEKNVPDVLNFLGNIQILDFDLNASNICAKIYSYLKRKGILTNTMDQMIASISISANKTLITRNTKHYVNIPDLKIERW